MKRSKVFKNLIVDFIIFLFVLKLLNPPIQTGEYSKAFDEISFSKLD